MREEDSNWFAKWEEELPSPEELMPLSQTLITPHLAQAFDIPNPNTPQQQHQQQHHHQQQQQQQQPPPQPNLSAEFESAAGGGGGGSGGGGDEPARTLKRPRLVWTPQLHKRFVDAVAHLGIKNAVPKTIMQLMSVDGLTRENVASHLQKYRLYLKRMQGINSNGNSNGVANGAGNGNVNVDPAMDHLFASSPVPAHFLRPNSDHFMPYVPVAAMQQHQHHPQVVVGQQFRHFGNSPPNGQFEQHPFLVGRQQPPQVQRMGTNGSSLVMQSSYVENKESATAAAAAANGRKVLTLFPTGED